MTLPETKTYLLGRTPDLGREQLRYLEALLDPPTIDVLATLDVEPGQRCLDLGAGGGTISRWLGQRVGADGRVLAVDITDEHFGVDHDVELHRQDIEDGVPPGGPFDLIHARLLLMHLPRREEILAELIDALAPGGWLVIGELCGPPLEVLDAADPSDVALFERIQHTICHIIGRAGGISYEWPEEVDGHLVETGMEQVHSRYYAQTTTGGGAGCLLHRNYAIQMEQPLRANGISIDELERYRELMLDRRFRAWF